MAAPTEPPKAARASLSAPNQDDVTEARAQASTRIFQPVKQITDN